MLPSRLRMSAPRKHMSRVHLRMNVSRESALPLPLLWKTDRWRLSAFHPREKWEKAVEILQTTNRSRKQLPRHMKLPENNRSRKTKEETTNFSLETSAKKNSCGNRRNLSDRKTRDKMERKPRNGIAASNSVRNLFFSVSAQAEAVQGVCKSLCACRHNVRA